MPPPNRWEEYTSIGKRIKDTRFIAFKVPLKQNICRTLPKDQRFSPFDLLEHVTTTGQDLKLVIDLTNTTKYYFPQDITKSGVKYRKLNTVGHVVPNATVVRLFVNEVDDFISKNSNTDSLIGVHCTHGVNRTGYLICRYMIDKLNFSPEDAIEAFREARGHPIERDNYIRNLKGSESANEEEDTEVKEAPNNFYNNYQRPHWRNQQYQQNYNRQYNYYGNQYYEERNNQYYDNGNYDNYNRYHYNDYGNYNSGQNRNDEGASSASSYREHKRRKRDRSRRNNSYDKSDEAVNYNKDNKKDGSNSKNSSESRSNKRRHESDGSRSHETSKESSSTVNDDMEDGSNSRGNYGEGRSESRSNKRRHESDGSRSHDGSKKETVKKRKKLVSKVEGF